MAKIGIQFPELTTGPTPETRAQAKAASTTIIAGGVVAGMRPIRSSIQVLDANGGIGVPYRLFDTIAVMEMRGTIQPIMRQAADQFRADFRLAGLDPLHAAPMELRSHGQVGLTGRQIDARAALRKALAALGGMNQPTGSAIWFIVGCENSIKDWALRQSWSGRPIAPETASGILIGALGVLASHYHLT